MKRLKWIAPLVPLCIALGGCPYSSELPIDTASVKINPALLGKWEPKNSSDDKYTVTKADDFSYKIEKKTKDAKESTFYKAFISMIDEDQFLNLSEENGSSSKSYYFYKMEINSSGSKVTLMPVTENITEKFTSSDEMKSFFKKYKNLSFFFSKDAEVFIKD